MYFECQKTLLVFIYGSHYNFRLIGLMVKDSFPQFNLNLNKNKIQRHLVVEAKVAIFLKIYFITIKIYFIINLIYLFYIFVV